MPFELGIDIGSRELGNDLLKTKRCLVFEKERFRYQRVLSGLSGNDIKAHDGDPIRLVKAVRNWFAENEVYDLPSPNKIWDAYNEFLLLLTKEAEILGYEDGDYSEIPIPEYIYLVTRLSQPMKA